MANLIDLLEAFDGNGSVRPNGQRYTERLQRKLAAQLEKATPAFLKECEFRMVQTVKEFEQVAQIIQNASNRADKSERPIRAQWFSLAQATNKSITFICMYRKKYILGAVSFVIDSSLGIPMAQRYKKHVNRFRAMGRQLAEVTALALNGYILNDPAHKFSHGDRLALFLKLLKTSVAYLKQSTQVDTVVTHINRRHEQVYKALLFSPLTGLEYYTGQDQESFPGFFLDLDYIGENDQKGVMSRLWEIQPWEAVAVAEKPLKFCFYEFINAFSAAQAAA
jgi:hypothetical protein